jgi:uncharacterized protein YecE (DUF72 family)
MPVRTGTSGFSYSAWKGPFYPPKCPSKRMLVEYGLRLGTVEINNTFYKLPKTETFAEWAAAVPTDFRFSLKASRFITYSKKLRDCAEALSRFFDVASPLKERLGPLLVQLPPFFSMDIHALDDFVGAIPNGKRVALELRHPSWRDDAVYAKMKAKNVAWVGVETDDETAHLPSTSDWSYVSEKPSIQKKT